MEVRDLWPAIFVERRTILKAFSLTGGKAPDEVIRGDPVETVEAVQEEARRLVRAEALARRPDVRVETGTVVRAVESTGGRVTGVASGSFQGPSSSAIMA